MTTKEFKICPRCNVEPDEEQPIAGLHAFSILYKCGNIVDIVISTNEYKINNDCRK